MKISAFIPYWLEYQVDEIGYHKNLKKLGNRYLIDYSISLLNSVDMIDETVVYCSNKRVTQYINQELSYRYQTRDKGLDNNDISIDKLIESYLNESNADIVILLHPNSPFLSRYTLMDCLSKVISGQYDSSFTAYEFKKLSWYKDRPLNYSLSEETPKLANLNSVIVEHSSLYIFRRDSFEINHKRVGVNPYVKIINHFEGLEVDSEEDYQIAELIVNSGMYPKV